MASTLNNFSLSAGCTWSMDDADTFSKTANAGSFSAAGVSYVQGGAGGLAMDKIYRLSTTISASSNLDIDLAGALTDFFGATLTFARVKAILFEHLGTSAATAGVRLGAASVSNGVVSWTLPPIARGGFFAISLPDTTAIAVTAGTGDKFRMANDDSTNAASVRFVFGGSST